MSGRPVSRYATNGDIHLAYQVMGDGPDMLLIDTWVHHVEAVWDFPDVARFLRRLSSFGRLIHFDRRGTGLSDSVPVDDLPDFDTQVGDAIAVLDAAGSDSATIIGLNDGTIVASLLAAERPERCRSLVLFSLTAAHTLAAGMPMESIDDVIAMLEASALSGDSGVRQLAPSRVGDELFDQHLSRLQRFSVRPGAYGHFYRQTIQTDITAVLPSIRPPALVLNRTGNRIVPVDQSRMAAAMLTDATFVELPGSDHLAFSEGLDDLVDEIEEFVTGSRTGIDPDRKLVALMFTDIVDSTSLASELGDRRWRDLLDQHHAQIRRQLDRFGGTEVATTGDGFFASFERPLAAVRCALEAAAAMPSLGLQIRAGVHVGEVEVRGSDLGGLAVHIAARVASEASAGQVVVSSTVKDLLAGSGIEMQDHGEHELKGVPGTWSLYRISSPIP